MWWHRVGHNSSDLAAAAGGSVVKNLPANAGDTGDAGLIPGPGRGHGATKPDCHNY